jgi:hypothetical protein
MAKIGLHSAQAKVAEDTHRFKVICAGRRWGKSVLSRMIVLQWATKTPGLYWIVSPTYKQAKMIHWREIAKEIPGEWIAKKNEVELSITLHNGSIIELKGAENPDTLRGVKLRGLVIDEIASIRNWDWLWSEVLRPTLTDYEAPAIFISTPKGFNHFHELFESGQGENDLYKSWRFTSYDNPHIPSQEIDNAKLELTENTFAQEYMADFRKYTGLVYKEFEREIHVVEPFDLHPEWQIFRSFDFGTRNPMVCLWIAVDKDDNWWVVNEYYNTGETIDYHAGVINANPLSASAVQSFGDPSGAQWIMEFNSRRIFISPANKETGTEKGLWTRLGIEMIQERLKSIPGHFVEQRNDDNQPSIFVFNNCVDTIKEFETYRWKEKSATQAQDINQPESPEKANDHAMDALRYFAVSYKKTVTQEAPQQWKDDQWKIGKK